MLKNRPKKHNIVQLCRISNMPPSYHSWKSITTLYYNTLLASCGRPIVPQSNLDQTRNTWLRRKVEESLSKTGASYESNILYPLQPKRQHLKTHLKHHQSQSVVHQVSNNDQDTFLRTPQVPMNVSHKSMKGRCENLWNRMNNELWTDFVSGHVLVRLSDFWAI